MPNPFRTSPTVALAACSFALPALAEGSNFVEIQLTPAGAFGPSDGRPMSVRAWQIDAAIAGRVIQRFQERSNPVVVDYEHQTLHKENNGQPAPAAAWMRSLKWREGSGLWATVELTTRAANLIRAGEYRYVSPVFLFDEQSGQVLSIEMAAITNTPAIDGMAQLAARAAATSQYHSDTEDSSMTLLAAIVAALGLKDDTTEIQAIAACSALKPRLETLDKLTQELGVTAPEGALAACSALKSQATAVPDPAKYVPAAALNEVQAKLAALSAERLSEKVTTLVDAGLADGRLLPSMKAWATDLGGKDLAALSAYLDAAPAIAALGGTQTGGLAPNGGKDEHGLTQAELAVCSMTGITPKDYAAAKPTA